MSVAVVYLIGSGVLLTACLLSLISPRGENLQATRWRRLLLWSRYGPYRNALTILSPQTGYQILHAALEIPRFSMAPALYLAIIAFTKPA